MFLTTPEFHLKFISANDTKKDTLLCVIKRIVWVQVKHEYLIRKNFLLRVNHDDNRKKAVSRLGQLKHHSLINTF